MRRLVVLLLICMMVGGCAWSRGRVRHYDPTTGKLTEDIHCWTVVGGKGRLGAECDKKHAQLASEDTGVDDNFIKMMGAISEGAARGAKGGL